MSVFSSGLIWFGAGVSIAEIITGTYFAPLGFAKGFAAILIGHAIGCALLFFDRRYRRKDAKDCHANNRLEFWKSGLKIFWPFERGAAFGLDRHYDL